MKVLRHLFESRFGRRVPGALPTLVGIITATVTGWVGFSASATAAIQTAVGVAVPFSCSSTETAIRNAGATVVSSGTSRIYIGYQQVSSDNKNPIVVRFDNGRRIWCRNNIEITGDDGEGYGLLWNEANLLYGVFSATGTQGTATQDYRRFTANGWLTSYGSGGGPRVSVLLQLNPTTGQPIRGTFINAVRSDGRTNSLVVRNLEWTGRHVVVTADSWYSPRRINRQPFTCSGASPFVYRLWLTPDLQRAVDARASRCL